MSRETISLPVVRYRDKAGQPTCASDIPAGDKCVFLGVTGMCGKYEICAFGPDRDGIRQIERRGDGILGTMIPRADCPVWAAK